MGNEKVDPKRVEQIPDEWPLYQLWEKYEDVAMHFNDLLIKLRVQALGGVAALSTLVGIFTKTDVGNVRGSWEIATGVFGALCLFWIAIWVLDLLYYNRLLLGSVAALLELEEQSKGKNTVRHIKLSTIIAQAVASTLPNPRPAAERFFLLRGVWIFYSVVMLSLLCGFALCLYKHLF